MCKRLFVLVTLFVWLKISFTGLGLGVEETGKYPIPEVTPTAIPARDLDLLPKFEYLMTRDDEYCSLPCWWGFKPNETELSEIVSFVRSMGFEKQWKKSIYADTFSLREYLQLGERIIFDFQDTFYDMASSFELSFIFENEILTGTSVVFNKPNEWLSAEVSQVSLSDVLSQIDEIPEIYVSNQLQSISHYVVILVYRQLQMQISYTFDLSLLNDLNRTTASLNLCLDIESTNRIHMQLNYLDSDIRSEPPKLDTLMPLEDIYPISPEEFVQFFRENPDDCLEVPYHPIEEPREE